MKHTTKDAIALVAGMASGFVIAAGLAAPNGSLWNLAAACVCAGWIVVLIHALRPMH